jgi:hypothetical protein
MLPRHGGYRNKYHAHVVEIIYRRGPRVRELTLIRDEEGVILISSIASALGHGPLLARARVEIAEFTKVLAEEVPD